MLMGCNMTNQLINSGRGMNPHKLKVKSESPRIKTLAKKRIGNSVCKKLGYSKFDTMRVYEINCVKSSYFGCNTYEITYIVDCH
jgi:hypothetical protein